MFSIKKKIGKFDFHQIQPLYKSASLFNWATSGVSIVTLDASYRISFELTEMTLSTICNCIVLDCYSMYVSIV